MPVVVCDNVIKIHKQGALEVIALQGLDFAMETGEFVAIVGPSGSGKSSLLTILGGMDQPSAGYVEVSGTDVTELTSPKLVSHFRRNVGFVWQDYTRNLVPYLRVASNIELPMLFAGVGRRARKQRVSDLIEITGLGDVAYGRVNRLSGGEQQRVALCVALALGPSLLLADEPTGELDTERSIQLFELLQRLCHEGGLTVLTVTHDVTMAQRADRTVRLEDGRILTERSLASEADLLAIDQRGRIQIPREMLDEAGLSERAEAEVREGEIILRRPNGT